MLATTKPSLQRATAGQWSLLPPIQPPPWIQMTRGRGGTDLAGWPGSVVVDGAKTSSSWVLCGGLA